MARNYLLQPFTIFVFMNAGTTYLYKEQRLNAIQRLTALWAFTESGLGGIMHALQIPFTGLVVGGMAVIMISLIAAISNQQHKQVLKSTLIVLIVKAMVSPHTPFPAYIAVSFQALLGYALFSLLKVNFISIFLLSTLAMLESALQKIIILTLIAGKSLWAAMDSMIAWLGNQFGTVVLNGTYWLLLIYVMLYLIAGIIIALLAYRSIKHFDSESLTLVVNTNETVNIFFPEKRSAVKKRYKKIGLLIMLMLILSAVLFVFAADEKQGWLAVAKTISWTLSAILIWFLLISPLLTKAIQKILQKKESSYSNEVLKVLSFLPVLKQLTALSWQQTKLQRGFKRWSIFISLLIHATLTYADPAPSEIPFNHLP